MPEIYSIFPSKNGSTFSPPNFLGGGEKITPDFSGGGEKITPHFGGHMIHWQTEISAFFVERFRRLWDPLEFRGHNIRFEAYIALTVRTACDLLGVSIQ